MPLLDAAVAFAITMLAVATVVTRIIDWLPKLVLNRSALFDRMLRKFLDAELAMIIARVSDKSPDDAKAVSAAALNEIKNTVDGTHLSKADLIDRLKQTDLGTRLLQGSGSSDIFAEISRRYSVIEKQFSEIFRTRTKMIATIVAFILAIAFNIDSVNILGSYISNPTLSASVAAKSDQAMADYTARLSAVKDESQNEEVLKQFDKSHKALQQELDRLNSGVFPFGWSYFPYGPNPPKPWSLSDLNSQNDQSWKASWKAWKVWLSWLIGVCITAVLAGLGTPFWYDVIRRITQITRAGSQPDPAPAAIPPATIPPATIPPATIPPAVLPVAGGPPVAGG